MSATDKKIIIAVDGAEENSVVFFNSIQRFGKSRMCIICFFFIGTVKASVPIRGIRIVYLNGEKLPICFFMDP